MCNQTDPYRASEDQENNTDETQTSHQRENHGEYSILIHGYGSNLKAMIQDDNQDAVHHYKALSTWTTKHSAGLSNSKV